MYQLVTQNVIGLGQRARHRQHDPALERLGHTAGGFIDLPGERRRLLEVRVIGVEDDRLPSAQLVVEDPGQPGVPALCHTSRLFDGFAGLGIVVDVKVLGLEHLKVEILVLNLVPTEILGFGGPGPEADTQSHRDKRGYRLTVNALKSHLFLQYRGPSDQPVRQITGVRPRSVPAGLGHVVPAAGSTGRLRAQRVKIDRPLSLREAP